MTRIQRTRGRLVAAVVAVAGIGAAVAVTTFASAAVPPATGEQVVTATIEVSGVFDGGSATGADDKVFQDNRAAGGSVTIRNFEVSDFGKLYRSCGNCSTQAARTVRLENITATAPGDVLAGINVNLGDRLTIDGVTLAGDDIGLCDLFEGNDTGDEPRKIGSGPDGTSCVATGVTGP